MAGHTAALGAGPSRQMAGNPSSVDICAPVNGQGLPRKAQVSQLSQAAGDCQGEGQRVCRESAVGPYTSWLCVYDAVGNSGLDERRSPTRHACAHTPVHVLACVSPCGPSHRSPGSTAMKGLIQALGWLMASHV